MTGSKVLVCEHQMEAARAHRDPHWRDWSITTVDAVVEGRLRGLRVEAFRISQSAAWKAPVRRLNVVDQMLCAQVAASREPEPPELEAPEVWPVSDEDELDTCNVRTAPVEIVEEGSLEDGDYRVSATWIEENTTADELREALQRAVDRQWLPTYL